MRGCSRRIPARPFATRAARAPFLPARVGGGLPALASGLSDACFAPAGRSVAGAPVRPVPLAGARRACSASRSAVARTRPDRLLAPRLGWTRQSPKLAGTPLARCGRRPPPAGAIDRVLTPTYPPERAEPCAEPIGRRPSDRACSSPRTPTASANGWWGRIAFGRESFRRAATAGAQPLGRPPGRARLVGCGSPLAVDRPEGCPRPYRRKDEGVPGLGSPTGGPGSRPGEIGRHGRCAGRGRDPSFARASASREPGRAASSAPLPAMSFGRARSDTEPRSGPRRATPKGPGPSRTRRRPSSRAAVRWGKQARIVAAPARSAEW
jgi:hypothetical protein